MPELRPAELIELNPDLEDVKPGGKRVRVQFNPETLKVTFSTQTSTAPRTSESGGSAPRTGDQASGTAGRQYLGAGATKLALSLWFDCTAATDPQFKVDDVRRLTQQIVYFMMAQRSRSDPNVFVPPGVRFQWGAFRFDGLIDSLDESLEYFSSEGRPLRATMSLALSQQKILKQTFGGGGAGVAPGAPGTQPLAQAAQGLSMQALAEAAGQGTDWRDLAAANGVENPRLLEPGHLLNLNRFSR
jgi:hypothetical protein